MAATLLRSRGRVVVTYARNLQWLCANRREFSSQGRSNSNETSPPPDVKEVSGEPIHTWLNIKAGIFGPIDQRLPLPGDVGPSQHLEPMPIASITYQRPVVKTPPDVLTTVTNHEQQVRAISQFNSKAVFVQELLDLIDNMPQPSDFLECRAQECPELVKKDFLDLFPGYKLGGAPLTIVTLSQKTEHDMSGWTSDMEGEREALMEYFLEAADEICSKLMAKGYWADFIDPSSGRPFHGPYTNATLFETDERYRHMGFYIEDLGCCKVISHRLWGTHVFVGAIFTNAPVDSKELEEVMSLHQKSEDEDKSE